MRGLPSLGSLRYVGRRLFVQVGNAMIRFKDGLQYWTGILDGLTLSTGGKPVRMYTCSDMPIPFWSRASQIKTATIDLPADVSSIKEARLMVKVWDGGAGTVKAPFKINGHPYSIISGRAIHDVVFTDVEVDPVHLKGGPNILTLVSDTEHHGIEMLLPGPCFLVRYGAPLPRADGQRPSVYSMVSED